MPPEMCRCEFKVRPIGTATNLYDVHLGMSKWRKKRYTQIKILLWENDGKRRVRPFV